LETFQWSWLFRKIKWRRSPRFRRLVRPKLDAKGDDKSPPPAYSHPRLARHDAKHCEMVGIRQ
jgi:hypothetical protein